jgi:transcriptional regulator
MEIFFVLVILILASLIVYLLWYILVSRKKLSGEEESDILTLLTEFKHVADMKIAALEDKSDKLRLQLKRANETIARLTSVITDAEKIIDVMKTVYEDDVEEKILLPNSKTKKSKLINSKNSKDLFSKSDKKKGNIANDHKDQISNKKKSENSFDEFTNKVLKLYNEGWNVDDIARMLDKGKGEVALVLNFNSLKKGGNYEA